MLNAVKRWWRWLFQEAPGPAPKPVKRYKCHYTAEQWAVLASAQRGDIKRLAREWGRTRTAIYEAYRKAQRGKHGNGTTEAQA